MRVQEFRNLIDAALQLITDWHACVGDRERAYWRTRAEPRIAEVDGAECKRASAYDLEQRLYAREQLLALLTPKVAAAAPAPAVPISPASPGQSRAASYNKSASRAVRLGRAARSAMRRGYF